MRLAFFIFFLSLSITSIGQNYVRSNEEVIFRFITTEGRQAYLVKDTSNKYIVYRYGTNTNIELEYPEQNSESWKKFTYSYNLRGGGVQNEGMDLNYISFINHGVQYVLYYTYFAVGNKVGVGIKVIDQTKSKKTDIKGIPKTRKGSLTEFRDNGLLEIGEELFD